MADGLAFAKLVDVGLDVVNADVEVVVEELEHSGLGGRFRGILHGEEFDAVAGGEDEGFADSGLVGERACGVGETSDRDRETLTDLDRRGGVVHAEEEEFRVGVGLGHSEFLVFLRG
jgi:hypothetical protein